MAKTSKIAKNEQRIATVTRHAERRAALKSVISSVRSTPAERAAAVTALAALPRDSSPVRVRNRDAIDGRPRGYVGVFGLSRIRLRSLVHRGELPGVTLSSW